MAFEMKGLDELARGMKRAVKTKRNRDKQFAEDVSEKFFEACASGDYADDEGTLRASFAKGSPDRIEEQRGDELVLGTKVYYAPMVDEGHVIGVRAKGHSRKKGGRSGDTYTVVKGFAKGSNFMQKALDEVEGELPKIADDLLNGIGKEAGLV